MIALSGLYGTVALWRALFDTNTASRLRRMLTFLGLAFGVVAATLVLIPVWRDLFMFTGLLLSLISMVLVGTYHLVRLVQLEVRSRTAA